MGTGQQILLFDGDCSFCRIWVEYWRGLTGERVEYLPFQRAGERFPEISKEDAARGIVFADGESRYSSARGVLHLLGDVPGYGWLRDVYEKLPGFAPFVEGIYRLIASHRNTAYWITRILWGKQIEEPRYRVASRLFLRALAFIYLIAFVSFGIQVSGLIGSRGILPIESYLGLLWRGMSTTALWRLPTVFWFAHSDSALSAVCWSGAVLAILAALLPLYTFAHRLALLVLYVLYLSVSNGGQIFMSYQWDSLLLEAGFLAIFLKPVLPRVWLFQWLIFRLMFESGAAKLLSNDPTWRGLTALSYHYETQPLPTVIGWWVAQAPQAFQKASTAFALGVEVLVPFLMLGPRRFKQTAALCTILLQTLIFLTGNYTFFNLLAMALTLFLLDDSWWSKWIGKKPGAAPRENRLVSAALFVLALVLGCAGVAQAFGRAFPSAALEVASGISGFNIVNQYGLFASMTTSRPEIEIQGSDDGRIWKPYVFRDKAGPLDRAPRWVQPYQPRLNWQMWFAALGSYRESEWFSQFVYRLLTASPPVLRLLEQDPFSGRPPHYVRAELFEYHFTDPATLRLSGRWWKREYKGEYFPAVSLRAPDDAR